ncbi:hypothetical protein CTAYLR_005824 [Chrysophaeum taylorii]|uniref:Tyrosyl-DNA phosphodiesterase 1 n=1 Tax=Chrysophaeum taylorii TaxID=2483200 RepID=A0AAD7UPI1_9STRA|nr:hypothetical protein CTAYLR_005824 [Chrysophaeum taylorii]
MMSLPPQKKARIVVDLTKDSSSQKDSVEVRPAWHPLRTVRIPAAGNEHAVGFRDIVVVGKIEWAVVSNFMIDAKWLLSVWPEARDVPRVVIFSGDGRHNYPPNFDVYDRNPKQYGYRYGCHHAKFLILKFRDHLRVAVTTANFIRVDFHEKSQGAWMQDFPVGNAGSDFEDSLCDYLDQLAKWPVREGPWGPSLSQAVREFDFSKATAHLVPTVPGRHEGATMRKYGHVRVRHLEKEGGAHLVVQFSSMASTKGQYKKQLETSFGGGPMKIVWPTARDVRTSVGGYSHGRSLPSKHQDVEALRDHLHKWAGSPSPFVAARAAASPHLKTVSRLTDDRVAWSFLGSQNISRCAWGELQKGDTQLYCQHWELGVLVTANSLGVDRLVTTDQLSATSANRVSSLGVVPLPFPASPAIKYDHFDRPWVATKEGKTPVDYDDLPDDYGAINVMQCAESFYDCTAPAEERCGRPLVDRAIC